MGSLGGGEEASARHTALGNTVCTPFRLSSFLKAHLFNVLSRAFTSVDPAPPTSNLLAGRSLPDDISDSSIALLQTTLVDSKRPLFERYRAMFALRNIGTPAAVDALSSGFSDDSALFK